MSTKDLADTKKEYNTLLIVAGIETEECQQRSSTIKETMNILKDAIFATKKIAITHEFYMEIDQLTSPVKNPKKTQDPKRGKFQLSAKTSHSPTNNETCHLKPRCAHCAVEYTTTECTQPKESSKTCGNCKGSHVAYWRGCTRFPRKRHHQSKRKFELIEKAPIRDSENFPQLQHLIHPQTQLSTKELPMRTSFQSNHINNHTNKQNQLQPYDANPLINSPRRNKWARCTESLPNSSPRTTKQLR
ncbi:hypothetical protein CEXT_333831 [Caerostris extrusa]|uniref:Gag protein n=1 Tax=Caerostris extrusa TaxID=172846 RepID=A0AAV4N834_CAEEX|nr:hypothetical protein CEXT_333831 [Caerostris extrusa]